MSNNQVQPQVQLQRVIVKQVLSGDYLIVRGQPRGGPPPEKQISLAWVQAPKVGRRIPPNNDNPKGSSTPDEAYGWEARESLRKKVVGKEITFRTEYKVPVANNQMRECGVVFLEEENVLDAMVSEGLVELIRRKQNSDNPEFVRLSELEEKAKLASKGKWAAAGSSEKREVYYDVEEPAKLLNKTFNGIVEHTITGSTIRVALELDHMRYQVITLMFSGIKCPPNGETFGDEARFFTESRILQRDVQVRVEQISGNQNSSFIGSVICGNHNIAEYLVKEGMAKCIDWTLALTMSPEKLRASEKEAKSKKLRIWKDYKEIKTNNESFEAKVIEVMNGDALMVQTVDKKEKKIFLASIRPPPRPEMSENAGRIRPLYDVPYMLEAREFLRKRLIHKKVRVKVDYVQPKTDNFPEKTCCSVFLTEGGNMNIGEALISKGLASVVKYRPDDESRSSSYDALLAAEMKAQKTGKGIHANSGSGPVRVVELSNDLQKAKQFLPFLLRGSSNSRKEGVVEYVYSASRIKIFIPKENCLLNLILVGVNAPKNQDPYAEEAKLWVKSLIHQKDIEMTVESMDKVGNFVGTLYFDDKNLSVELLKNGFGMIRDERGLEFKRAEDEAKEKKLKIWENFKEEDESKANEDNGDIIETSAEKENRKSMIITQITNDMKSFYAQNIDDGPGFEELLNELREELTANPPLPGAFHPKKGEFCAAKYSEDGLWYRAKVEKQFTASELQVIFIDYGNREKVTSNDLAPFPSSKFSPTSFQPAAKEYALAFVSLPDADLDLVEEAREAFSNDTADKVLLLKTEYKDTNTNIECVTLVDKESKKDIVLELVNEGYFMLDVKGRREKRLFKIIGEYKSAQESAKKKRLNLWRYGDFTEDDAKEFGLPKTA